MSNVNQSYSLYNGGKLAEVIDAIEKRDWKTLDRLTGMSPEEAERILREEPMMDAADFNRIIDELDARS